MVNDQNTNEETYCVECGAPCDGSMSNQPNPCPSAICQDCAKKRGWKPLGEAVWMWQDTCEDCGEKKPVCAGRDYIAEEIR